jgi:hypothetical protein
MPRMLPRPLLAPLRHLALLAMLLLSLAPSVNRLLAAPGAGWVQLCTMTGLRQVWQEGTPLPSPHRQDEGDCAYCPLLGALLGAAVVLLTFGAERRTLVRPQPGPRPLLVAGHRGSLGARGPPARVRIGA